MINKPIASSYLCLFFCLIYFLVNCCSPEEPQNLSGGIENPSFTQDIQPIFTNNCALSGCHNNTASAGLNLEVTKSYAAIVNVSSSLEAQKIRVIPGNAQDSYLVLKIEDRQTEGARMPLGRSQLTISEINTIKNWIDKGAKDN